MSKTLSMLLSSLIIILAAATINIRAAQARTDSEFPELSVRSQQQANYGVDVNFGVVPAISMDIIQDMIQDNAQAGSTGGPDQVIQQLQTYGGSEPETGTCIDVWDPDCTGDGNGSGNGAGNGNGNGNPDGNGGCNGVGNPNCTGNPNGNANGNANGNGGCNGVGNPNCTGNSSGNGRGNGNGNDNSHGKAKPIKP
jgi:hypothetical protein